MDWLWSLAPTLLLLVAGWLFRNPIAAWSARKVQHGFDVKLESVRAEFRRNEELLKADLQSKEAEIAALRTGILTALTSRQVALDNRRIEAVDHLWAVVTAQASAKPILEMMASMRFDKAAEVCAHNAQFREFIAVFGAGFDPKDENLKHAERERPFVSPLAWALFSAYQAVLMHAVAKMEVLKAGVGAIDVLNDEGVAKLVKAALPGWETFIDEHGERAYHVLIGEIEKRLLEELRSNLNGTDTDKANLKQVADVMRQLAALQHRSECAVGQNLSETS